ncbi:hypothetical protein HDG34_005866 [Paraburkholderia sp. HC6.4b]|uniref:hypothetical protein n=1 Tax=unclassified Paraburkholderia TaxID=2615204 RepID=UPI00160F74C4|nr:MULTISPECIES: hypothetical protein [unclassified Paraburkholderia]MBB5411900.1 hypothetical protein [Paraburkholderia sp. HC6.4b]MBB5450212.1 hypothetical protein [Paraburkholderia sp. Kb1A]
MFPMVPVDFKSDYYFKYRKSSMMRNDFRPRAPGTESAGSGFDMLPDQYMCDVYALHKDIPDQIRSNVDAPLQLDQSVTQFLTQQSLIQREGAFATRYLSTDSGWKIVVSGVATAPVAGQFRKWSDAASDPIEDIKSKSTEVQRGSGFRPNVLTMAQDVRDALDTNPAVIDRIKYSGGTSSTSPAQVTDVALAQLFGVDEIVISSAVQATTPEGAEEENFDFIVSGKVLLAYRTKNPGLMVPSAGYVFSWRNYIGNPEGVAVKKFRMEHLESDRVECSMAYDMKMVGADLGALFDEVV